MKVNTKQFAHSELITVIVSEVLILRQLALRNELIEIDKIFSEAVNDKYLNSKLSL